MMAPYIGPVRPEVVFAVTIHILNMSLEEIGVGTFRQSYSFRFNIKGDNNIFQPVIRGKTAFDYLESLGSE